MNNSKGQSRIWLVLALVCIMASAALGQVVTGTISGTVNDPTGAAVPGATVTISNAETGVAVFTGTTGEDGLYNAPSLPVGRYNIAVEAPNFKRTEISNVQLAVDQRARIDAQLEAGGVNETVTVIGDSAGQLERDTSSQSQVLDTNKIRDLPTFARNPLNLLNLIAGVSSGNDPNNVDAQQISINGSRTSNNEIVVDGVSITQGGTGRPTALPSQEALREFRVLTSAYSAEYGRTSGGYISAVVASGGSKFRGSLYEFFRNEKLNANSYFNNANNRPRQKDRYNLFGFRLDGPVFFPNFGEGGPVINKNRERTFFLVNYEGRRQIIPANPSATVPDEAYRNGDFSRALASNIYIADPQRTGLCQATPANPVAGVNYQAACFPGNIIPQNRIDPAARAILSLVPLPNVQGGFEATTQRFTGNYLYGQSLPNDKDEINTRIDHNFNTNARMFGRFSYIDSFSIGAQNIPGVLGGNSVGTAPTKTYQLALGYTQSLTPSLLFEFNGGYVRENFKIIPFSEGIDVPSLLGIQRATANVAPQINISGYAQLGTNSNAKQDQITNTYQGQASLSYVRGNNTLKFGGQYRLNEFNVFFPNNNYAGIYNFDGSFTEQTTSNLNAVYGLADFLLGLPRSANYSLPQPKISRRNYYYGLYVQDDLKVTRKLTVNLGLRYDLESPLRVKGNVYSRIDPFTGRLLVATDDESLIGQEVSPIRFDRNNPTATNPATGQVLIAGQYSDKYLGLKSDKNNFGPRVGLAYSLDDKTVIRTAFGMFYQPLFNNLGASANFTGFTVENRLYGAQANGNVPVRQPFTLNQGIPLNITQDLSNPFFYLNNPFNLAQARNIGNPLNSTNLSFAETDPMPYIMQFNFGVQREILKGIIADVSYVGSRGKHQPLQLVVNAIPFDPVTVETLARLGADNTQNRQLFRPNALLDNIFAIFNAGSSSYDSFQAKLTRNFAQSFGFSAAYTFSKALDNGSGLFNGTQIFGTAPNYNYDQDRNLERAYSTFDRPHVFSASAQYTTNIGPRFLRNFVINPIVQVRSGTPITIFQTVSTNSVFFQQRPSMREGFTYNDLYAGGFTPVGTTSVQYLTPALIGGASNPNFPLRPSGALYYTSTNPATNGQRLRALPFEYPNLPRNVVRAPGDFIVNLGAGRRFALTERVSMQFRGELLNLFNRTNFNQPDTNLSYGVNTQTGDVTFNSGNFGRISSTKSPRQAQLVFRLDF